MSFRLSYSQCGQLHFEIGRNIGSVNSKNDVAQLRSVYLHRVRTYGGERSISEEGPTPSRRQEWYIHSHEGPGKGQRTRSGIIILVVSLFTFRELGLSILSFRIRETGKRLSGHKLVIRIMSVPTV